mmetsp:Transcript_24336/g.50599  ORF Transcript_24336/g.50599 Transcript_24336/m.50599 type:complete len:111 (+) Transcript_24336:240-572(+)
MVPDNRFSVQVEEQCQREKWSTQKEEMQDLCRQFQGSPGFAERAHEFWSQNQGNELQEALSSGAIALLDAQWLVDLAYDSFSVSSHFILSTTIASRSLFIVRTSRAVHLV